MKTDVHVDDIDRFRTVVRERFGLEFNEGRVVALGELLRKRLAVRGEVCRSYLAQLEAGQCASELNILAQELTVGETYFFRHIDQFRAFSEVVLAERLRIQENRKRLRILSAGCASGEEAYTIAILVAERLDPAWDVSILGIDINATSIAKALHAKYSPWALRDTPPDIQRRYFQHDGHHVVFDETVKKRVKFEVCNLTDDFAQSWIDDPFDVIFCRNLIMYFALASAQALVSQLSRVLAPGGFLFLGSAETLRGLSPDFNLCHSHNTFYYQRSDRSSTFHETSPRAPVARIPLTPPQFSSIIVDSTSWVDAIQGATERVKSLATTSPHIQRIEDSEPPNKHSRCDLSPALELLRKERYADALGVVQALLGHYGDNADVLLLEAVLLTHRGETARAEQVCAKLLEQGELNSGAYYIMALCRESLGDLSAAISHDQTAIYLDPTFAMPRLHLGLLLRRMQNHEEARRELKQAISFLQCEDAPRLLLFGGGFTRDALIALCQAALAGNGGKT